MREKISVFWSLPKTEKSAVCQSLVSSYIFGFLIIFQTIRETCNDEWKLFTCNLLSDGKARKRFTPNFIFSRIHWAMCWIFVNVREENKCNKHEKWENCFQNLSSKSHKRAKKMYSSAGSEGTTGILSQQHPVGVGQKRIDRGQRGEIHFLVTFVVWLEEYRDYRPLSRLETRNSTPERSREMRIVGNSNREYRECRSRTCNPAS